LTRRLKYAKKHQGPLGKTEGPFFLEVNFDTDDFLVYN